MSESVAPARFKLRAEVMSDVGEVLKRLTAQRVEIVATPHDVVATFTDPSIAGLVLDLASLRAIVAEVENGHVMVETLATLEEYTGERTYGKPSGSA